MELRLLGPLEVVHEGRRADLTALRERAVLTFLLVDANRVVPVDRLIDRVWEGDPPESANVTLRVLVSRLRRALAAIGLDDVVSTRSPGYVVEVDADAYDVARFESLVTEGRRALDAGDPRLASDVLRGALALWRGDAFGELANHSLVRAEAVRLDEMRLAALEACIEADLRCGRHDAATHGA